MQSAALTVCWNTVAGAGISNLQSRCISQWVESTLRGVCSYSAVGNLCSALLCVELDIAWIFFWCPSSITVLAGYILKLFPPVFFFFLLVFEYCTHEFIPFRSFYTRDAQTECMCDLVVVSEISLIR